ncbi:CDP-glycerol glycerophosphotransferase family protein [bacterium]|nr:CDP-glycerol glycerophosphotransferase family protein [bacterium]
MKTVFITITRGTLARNILRAGVLDKFLKQEDIRVVILIETKIYDYFKAEFDHPRIIIERIPNKILGKFRRLFNILFNGLVYTETEHRMLKYGGANKKPAAKHIYWLRHIGFSIASRIKLFKQIARWMEKNILIEKDYDYLFEKFNPDLVFSSSIYSKPDTILIKAARRFKIPSVSMPKSWDTVGRLFFRAPSDKIILSNDFMKDWVIKNQLIKEKDILVAGIPQFDVYGNKQEYLSKEEFCQKTDLDPQKPIILYASEGLWTSWDWYYLNELITKHNILNKYNIIARPHFSNLSDRPYDQFKKYKGVYIDDQNIRITDMFGDRWDPTKANMDWLAEVINISDVVVSFMTTFVLDVFAYDKPVVNIYYDSGLEEQKVPIKALYNCVHYNAVLAEKSVALAKNSQETMDWIDKYIKDSNIHSVERKKTVAKLCYQIDGRASDRIVSIIIETLNK